ncbi:MAG: hypothetical protein WCA84_16595 [Ignavibacteriaceae bacterium]|jgi:hypothetical protein
MRFLTQDISKEISGNPGIFKITPGEAPYGMPSLADISSNMPSVGGQVNRTTVLHGHLDIIIRPA